MYYTPGANGRMGVNRSNGESVLQMLTLAVRWVYVVTIAATYM